MVDKKKVRKDEKENIEINPVLAGILARHTDMELDKYEFQTKFCLEQGRLKRINHHSASLLYKLGFDPFQCEEEFYKELGNGDSSQDLVDLIVTLRFLTNPNLGRTKTLQYHKKAMGYLRGVRKELSTYVAVSYTHLTLPTKRIV